MEIAIQKNENGWSVYVEGISWNAITANFIEEAVNVYVLTFITNGRYTSFDDRVKQQDNKLTFCKENMRVEELLNRLSDMELDEPNDARFGNKKFFVNRLFTDAYVLTFWERKEVEKFILDISECYLNEIKQSIKAGRPYSTIGVTEDLVGSPNFDRFLDKRYNRWHDLVVREFEEGVKNGTIFCPGCK
ncbi:MAG: hypothetical protein IPP77_10875 [Bacteroidetes bacterium]|nr:hypothetical protein [Bacteroidota bacterium]